MYKNFLIGDLHLKRVDPLGVILPNGLNSRLVDKLSALKSCLDQAIAEEASDITLLGDVFDSVSPSEKVRELFWETMAPAIKKKIRIWILKGNHDTTKQMTNLAGERHILPDTVKIVFEPTIAFSTVMPSGPDFAVALIPYTENIEALQKWVIKEQEKSDRQLLTFGHIELKGAVLGASNTKMRFEMSPNIFSNDNHVLLGHIHKFQHLNETVTYVGDVVKDDYSERNDQKVYAVVTVDDNTTIGITFRDIPQRPMLQVDVLEEDINNIYNQENIPEDIDVKDALVKVVFRGSGSWLRTINKNKFKKRFKRVLKVDVDDIKTDGAKEVLGTKTSSMEEKVVVYCQLKGKDREYEAAGIEAVKEVQEEK